MLIVQNYIVLELNYASRSQVWTVHQAVSKIWLNKFNIAQNHTKKDLRLLIKEERHTEKR